ncbi:class I SAM-dependent methyltransferase [Saccharomonospora cyanea]|uniref:class I SAM-dependent methyltransferase n=1 Tax=Saccharomonospora cyanea TaxID=40989 RepID=UPI0005BC2F67|nr:class I SAM-dependent methyltransferase [Saccharomonospora cyanea]
MDESVKREQFDTAYRTESSGWVIGGPQPTIVDLERAGFVRGRVLDAGCGTGEHTIHLTRLGYDVLGVDFSEVAVDLARRNAERHGVPARFQVADMLEPTHTEHFDTVVDSALFHVFAPDDAARYARALHRVCRPGAWVHVLALALTDEPGFGPRISDTAIREAFTEGWRLDGLDRSRYRAVARGEPAERLGVDSGDTVDLPAWLARLRRQ